MEGSEKKAEGNSRMPVERDCMKRTRWCGGVVVWWCGGVVVWWCGVLVWWCGGVVVRWCGGMVVWRCGGVVWTTTITATQPSPCDYNFNCN